VLANVLQELCFILADAQAAYFVGRVYLQLFGKRLNLLDAEGVQVFLAHDATSRNSQALLTRASVLYCAPLFDMANRGMLDRGRGEAIGAEVYEIMRIVFFVYILITVFLIVVFGFGMNRGVMRSIFRALQLDNITANTSPGPQ
jgi:hypothetical protein